VPGDQQRVGVVGVEVLDAQRAGQAEQDAPDVAVEPHTLVGIVCGRVHGVRRLAVQLQAPPDETRCAVAAAERIEQLRRPQVLVHVYVRLRHESSRVKRFTDAIQ
jgi:hypothetical protein